MRRVSIRVLAALSAAMAFASLAPAQELVDRIAARVENDIILLSEVRALARYQTLVDGQPESDSQILDRLIDQWIVRNEAEASRFPQPMDAEIERTLDRLKGSFASPEEYEARKKQAGLTDADILAMVASQQYLSNYLDSRFRPVVQVDSAAIEQFYQNNVVPRAKARGQEPPTLEAARDLIQEALTQRGINEQADRWLKESRARLHIEKFLDEGSK
jgi:parvulin-like peptidyl-prolyl isomerase